MVPRDWYQFVRTVRGKKQFKVIEMSQDDFLAFSGLFQKGNLLKKWPIQCDTKGERLHWLKIKWLRFTDNFDVIDFKYDLEEDTPSHNGFKEENQRSNTTSPSVSATSLQCSCGYNPTEKDFLSTLNLIDKDCHSFYINLPTSVKVQKFDKLDLDDEHVSDTGE